MPDGFGGPATLRAALWAVLWAAGALAAVLLLVLGAARLARVTRLGRPRMPGPARLHLRDSVALDPRRRLLLVECDGRGLLVLTGPQDKIVGWLPAEGA